MVAVCRAHGQWTTRSYDGHMVGTMRALALSTHPGPTIAVTAVAVILGIGVGLDLPRLVLLGIAVLAGQASVGLSNDWIDAERDTAVGRTDKPVARGDITADTARSAAWVTAAVGLLVMAPLGPWAAFAHATFMFSAWTYNLGLKNTRVSVLPYIVSFGVLPLVITLSLEQPAIAAWWVMAAGALLGIAAHFANVLPDLADDAATGIRGLPHAFGQRASGVIIFLALAAASTLVAFGAGAPSPVLLTGFGFGIALAVAGAVLVLTRPASRLLFRLIIAAALVSVVMLAASGSRIVAIVLPPVS